jgi:hypothetical protein
MSSAALRLVPSLSTKVVGWVVKASVSLAAIHWKRGASRSVFASRPALTKCQRKTASALAQPTHDPVLPWSEIFHQGARRSFAAGIGGAAAMTPASFACTSDQSCSWSCEGRQLRILFTLRGRAIVLPPIV